MVHSLNAKDQHDRDHHRNHNQNNGITFHKTPLQNKTVEVRKVMCQQSESAEHQQHSQSDQKASAGNFPRMHRGADPAINFKKRSMPSDVSRNGTANPSE